MSTNFNKLKNLFDDSFFEIPSFCLEDVLNDSKMVALFTTKPLNTAFEPRVNYSTQQVYPGMALDPFQ